MTTPKRGGGPDPLPWQRALAAGPGTIPGLPPIPSASSAIPDPPATTTTRHRHPDIGMVWPPTATGASQKSPLNILLASLNTFQNGMTQPISTNNHGGDRLQGKGLDAGQVLLGGDWALVLPTHKLTMASLVRPSSKFVSLL